MMILLTIIMMLVQLNYLFTYMLTQRPKSQLIIKHKQREEQEKNTNTHKPKIKK
jgi:uncharacterized protein YqgQ